MIYPTYFNNFIIRSIHGFKLYSLEENRFLESSYRNFDNVFKFCHNVFTKDSIQYFRVQASPNKQVYTTITDVITIAKPNEINWVKFYVDNTYDYMFFMELGLSNHEVAELEILYADHNK